MSRPSSKPWARAMRYTSRICSGRMAIEASVAGRSSSAPLRIEASRIIRSTSASCSAPPDGAAATAAPAAPLQVHPVARWQVPRPRPGWHRPRRRGPALRAATRGIPVLIRCRRHRHAHRGGRLIRQSPSRFGLDETRHVLESQRAGLGGLQRGVMVALSTQRQREYGAPLGFILLSVAERGRMATASMAPCS